MATTMAAPVNNSISLATKYVPFLDEVYKRESLSSVLDTIPERVNWIGAQTAKVFKIAIIREMPDLSPAVAMAHGKPSRSRKTVAEVSPSTLWTMTKLWVWLLRPLFPSLRELQ